MKFLLKLLFKAVLTLVLTLVVARFIYGAGWYYNRAEYPWGFKLYEVIRDTFGAIGAEDAEDLMIYFTLCVAFLIVALFVWGIPRLVSCKKNLD